MILCAVTSVSGGGAYGSSTRDTVKSLEKAVEEHDLILKKPVTVIIFKEFGDNALVLRSASGYGWVKGAW